MRTYLLFDGLLGLGGGLQLSLLCSCILLRSIAEGFVATRSFVGVSFCAFAIAGGFVSSIFCSSSLFDLQK